MQIAFHIGANFTDQDRLLKALLKDAAALLQHGVAVPGPGRYRGLIRETLQVLDGAQAPEGSRDILLDAILDDDQVSRMVLSNSNFMAIPQRIFAHGVFYPQAATKLRALRRLFPDDQLSLFMALRHPVGFLQEAHARSAAGSISAYPGLITPAELRWSDVIHRMREAAPSIPLIIWCDEDTPVIWQDVLRALAGADAAFSPAGRDDLLEDILPKPALDTLQARLDAADGATPPMRHALIADALEAMDESLLPADQVTLAGIDEAALAEITASYDADTEAIAQMDGVTMIRPFAD